MTDLPLFAAILLLLSLAFAAASVLSLRRRRLLGFGLRALVALLLLAGAALLGVISAAMLGYRALTREVTAATVAVEPTGPRRFTARVHLPDGRDSAYSLAGDQLYVDAHILKWRPVANLVGLHTAYELDRIGGRYVRLSDEVDSLRTVHSLKRPKPLDMFSLRQRYAVLRPLLDAEYGSATFVAADRPARFEVRVSTTGLLVRRVGEDESLEDGGAAPR